MKLKPADLPKTLENRLDKLRMILVFGPDSGHIAETCDFIGNAVVEGLSDPFRLSTLSADELKQNPSRLIDEATALSMTGGRRLVRITGVSDTLLTGFQDLESIDQIEALIIISAGPLDSRSKLRRFFENHPNFLAIGCYGDSGKNLQHFIKRYLKKNEISLAQNALEYLVTCLGNDRLQTKCELEKLILMVGKSGHVDLEDVVLCIADNGILGGDDIAFDTADGNITALDRSIERARANGENPIPILRRTINHFQRLYSTLAIMKTGTAKEKALGRLSPPLFWTRRDQFIKQLEAGSFAHFQMCLERLVEAEIRCKSTGYPEQAICFQTLIGICLVAHSRQRNF